MINRESAIQRVQELVLNGGDMDEVRTLIQQSEHAFILTDEEIDRLVIEIQTAKSLTPRQNKRMIIRLFGLFCVLAGGVGIWLGPGFTRSHSPSAYGFWLGLLGITLIIAPSWSRESIQPPHLE